MLHKPNIDTPIRRLVAPLLDDMLLTTAEVARHWRQSADYVSNLRNRGDGPPWIKLPHGAVRYRTSDILAYDMLGQRGASPDVVRLVMASVPDVPESIRERITAALIAALYPSADR